MKYVFRKVFNPRVFRPPILVTCCLNSGTINLEFDVLKWSLHTLHCRVNVLGGQLLEIPVDMTLTLNEIFTSYSEKMIFVSGRKVGPLLISVETIDFTEG